jgi:ATP-dependent exoDNAse (exonuclease V) beta subunit
MRPVGTLITANAGCGKTFTLANRVLGWLVEHHRVQGTSGVRDVLAATFTRKAAGEIQQRILRHLARGALEPKRLATYLSAIDLEVDPTGDELLAVLEDVARNIDRLHINTLDGIFHRLARALPEAVGLPQGWTIGDEPALQSLQRAAIDTWLRSCDAAEVRELARAAEGEVLKGSMHRAIIKTIWGDGRGGGLIELLRRSTLGNTGIDPWMWLDGLSDEQISPTCCRLDDGAIRTAIKSLSDEPVPLTKADTPNKNWLKAHGRVCDAARDGRWGDLLIDSLVLAAVEGRPFSRVSVSDGMCEAMAPLIGHARQQLVNRIRTRIGVWRELLRTLSEAYDDQQREGGCYGFGDIAYRLACADVLSQDGMELLAWRLDATIRDLALDEFQDTSAEQARVLHPLLGEMFSGDGAHDAPRHLLVVADPKQSIYGWRGGTPMLIDWLEQEGGDAILCETIARSYRSSPVIMDFVNACFEGITTNAAMIGERDRRSLPPPTLAADCGLIGTEAPNPVDAALARWRFTPHESAETLKELTGQVCAYVAEKDDVPTLAATIAAGRLPYVGTIGILCPTNRNVAAVSKALGDQGVAVSQEGSGKVEDICAAARLLDVLRIGDHPGHMEAAYRVSHSPFGVRIGLGPTETLPDRSTSVAEASRRIRQSIATRGLPDSLADLVDAIAPEVDAREYASLRRIVTIASHWDSATPRRLSEFVSHVEQVGLGEASDASVRVMTMHASKGLEFDEVVLPWLDDKMVKESPSVCQGWSVDALGAIKAIAPSVTNDERVHTPILRAFHEQAFAGDLADRLSLLYVAVTRARRGLHLVFQPVKKDVDETLSPATFLRAALPSLDAQLDGVEDTPEKAIWRAPESRADYEQPCASTPPTPDAVAVRLRATPVAAAITPSQHDTASLGERCRLVSSVARRDGVVLHELFRTIEWLDDGPPDEDAIERAFDEAAIQLGSPVSDDRRRGLTERFFAAIEGELGPALRRSAHDEWRATTLEALPEHPLLAQLDTGVLRGRIDRLILGRDGSGVVTHAAILDFKSGRAETDGDRYAATEWYQSQLERYAEGVAAVYNLSAESIETGLLFVG